MQNQKNSHLIREILVRSHTLGSPNAKRQNSKSADKAQLGLQVLAETTLERSWNSNVSIDKPANRITSISDISDTGSDGYPLLLITSYYLMDITAYQHVSERVLCASFAILTVTCQFKSSDTSEATWKTWGKDHIIQLGRCSRCRCRRLL